MAEPGEARPDFLLEHGAQLCRHAGKQNQNVAARFEPQAGRGAARIRKHRGAFGDHGLAAIDFGHDAAEAAKAFLDVAQHAFVQVQFAAEKFGDGFAGAVVVGGAEAAAGDDQVGAIERVAKRCAHLVERIADDGLVHHANADLIQFGGEKKGIGVQPVGREQFGADGDNFCPHRWALTVERKALDVPVERVEGAVGGDHGAAGGQQREADDVAAAENELRLGLRREADDAALAAERSRDVEIAEAIEGESLRAPEPAEKNADFAAGSDFVDAVEARGGGAGDEEFVRWD